MSEMKDRQLHVNDLGEALANVGIHLTPEELHNLQRSVTVAG